MDRSRKQEAYDYLKQAILSNQLVQGAPISELAVSEALKMSRTPIREALRDLEHEGLVVSYPARGSFVKVITPLDIEEIYELRLLLEGWALERSIKHITSRDLEQIEKIFHTGLENQDWAMIHNADRELHKLIIDKCGSKRLAEFIDILNGQTEHIRYTSAAHTERMGSSYEEHLDLLRAIRERNLQQAQDALRNHLLSVSKSAATVLRFGGVGDHQV